MKKLLFIFLVLLLILPVSAHSGRTDSQGGHYDHSTGEYHFHHGYPAHQHVNGICPYDFDDRTGENSGTSGDGSSSKGSGVVSGTSNSSSAASDTTYTSSLPTTFIVIGCIVGFYCLLLLSSIVSGAASNRKHQTQWNEKRQELQTLYGGKTKRQIAYDCGMPANMEIGPDGLPKEVLAAGWGDSLTFYVSRSGQAYHRRPTCTKSAGIPTHATELNGRRPCCRCSPRVPNLEWYWAYRRIIKQLEDYKIVLADP